MQNRDVVAHLWTVINAMDPLPSPTCFAELRNKRDALLAAVERGEVPDAVARQRVAALVFTDLSGRCWRIDADTGRVGLHPDSPALTPEPRTSAATPRVIADPSHHHAVLESLEQRAIDARRVRQAAFDTEMTACRSAKRRRRVRTAALCALLVSSALAAGTVAVIRRPADPPAPVTTTTAESAQRSRSEIVAALAATKETSEIVLRQRGPAGELTATAVSNRETRWHVVADLSGDTAARFGVPREGGRVVLDGSGSQLAASGGPWGAAAVVVQPEATALVWPADSFPSGAGDPAPLATIALDGAAHLADAIEEVSVGATSTRGGRRSVAYEMRVDPGRVGAPLHDWLVGIGTPGVPTNATVWVDSTGVVTSVEVSSAGTSLVWTMQRSGGAPLQDQWPSDAAYVTDSHTMALTPRSHPLPYSTPR